MALQGNKQIVAGMFEKKKKMSHTILGALREVRAAAAVVHICRASARLSPESSGCESRRERQDWSPAPSVPSLPSLTRPGFDILHNVSGGSEDEGVAGSGEQPCKTRRRDLINK